MDSHGAGLRSSVPSLKTIASTLATQARGFSGVLNRGSTKALGSEQSKRSETTRSSEASSQEATDSPTPTPTPSGSTSEAVLLPWEVVDEDGDVMEVVAVKERILDMAVFRRTFVEPATGEEEYTFHYPTYKQVVKELLFSDPNLREKFASLITDAPTFIVTEENFWRNFFLRCNAVRVEEGFPSYLPEVQASTSSIGALASFQRFKRGVLLRKRRSTDGIVRMRHNFMSRRSASADSADPTAWEVDLGDLDLDLDGEIERELIKRRPSRSKPPLAHAV